MNPEMRGFYAISGDGKIQLVSPAHPAPHRLTYGDGLMVAVHEFTHLALDEVNPRLSSWLDEGAAVYFGPDAGRKLYDQVSEHIARADADARATAPSLPRRAGR